jgi:hypothetical protein
MERRKYVVSFFRFQENNQFLTTDDLTGDIIFSNFGFATVNINGIALLPSTSFLIKCNENEADYTKYSWVFDNVVGPTKLLFIYIKKYIPMVLEKPKQKYVLSVITFNAANSFHAEGDNVGDVLFYNSGGSAVVINGGLQLNSGQSFSVPANKNERDDSKYNFFFVVGFGGPDSLTIIVKKFIN